MITLKAIPKSFFFDRKAVIDRVGVAKVKTLSKLGAFVRRAAQTSMRYRKGKSQPGQPPSAHKETGALLRKLLFFSYDPSSDSVVVGPIAARRAEAPRLQEFGGKAKRTRMGVTRTVTYPPRPYMQPALSKSEPRIPKEWTGSVHS